MAANPKVFISYSWDSKSHAAKVLEFSNKLRSDGIDSVLDQYEDSPPEGWPRWMDTQINNSDFVLMVCTNTYKRRVMGQEKPGTGFGVRWEGNLIYQHIYNAGTTNSRFIPVLFKGSSFEHIPSPLQGATHYSVDNSQQYDKLYSRLRGAATTPKPALGKLKPLPKKKPSSLFLTGFIDIPLWNEAEWHGTLFVHDGVQPPFLAFLFKKQEPAIKIFEGWHKRLGPTDKFNELRISIVEGDIPGEQPGYTVHVSANIDNILKRADHEGVNIPRDYFMIFSRLNRMNPQPGSKNLERFKQDYQRFGSYSLCPAVREGEKIGLIGGIRLLKRDIELRNAAEITKTDPDAAVIPAFYKKQRSRK